MGAAYSSIGFIKIENSKMFDIEDDDTVRFSGEYYDRAEGYLFDFNSSMCQSNPYGNKVDTVMLNETDTTKFSTNQPVPSL